MEFEDLWKDLLAFRLGPFRMGASFEPHRVHYSRTKDSHLLSIRISPEVKKEEIKVRLMKPGVLEIEWPRKIKGEEIPVE